MNWTMTGLMVSLLAAPTILAQSAAEREVGTSAATTRDSTVVRLGEPVRLLAPALIRGRQYATFQGVEGQMLLLKPTRTGLQHWPVHRDMVDRLEVRRGSGRSRVHTGAAAGMIIGAATFALAGHMARETFDGVGSIVLAPVGVGIGALVGAFVGKSRQGQQWFAVPTPAASTMPDIAQLRR